MPLPLTEGGEEEAEVGLEAKESGCSPMTEAVVLLLSLRQTKELTSTLQFCQSLLRLVEPWRHPPR